MRLFATPAAVLMAALLCVLAAGCSRVSPAVGNWSLSARGRTITLALREDGTGTFTMAPLPQQPVSWTEKEGTVTLQIGGGAQASGGAGAARQAQPGAGAALTGTLSEDKKSMTVSLGPTTLTLQKQGD